MDITDRIIEKYKKDRSIKDEYVLNDDEMYLIDEIVQLKIGQTLPIDSVTKCDSVGYGDCEHWQNSSSGCNGCDKKFKKHGW